MSLALLTFQAEVQVNASLLLHLLCKYFSLRVLDGWHTMLCSDRAKNTLGSIGILGNCEAGQPLQEYLGIYRNPLESIGILGNCEAGQPL